MKLRFALAGLVTLGAAALTTGMASAMPLAPLGQSQAANVESVALVCGPAGCIRTAPAYRYGYGVRRGYAYGARRGGYAYGYRRGYGRY
ncbi:hypothetical protein [uncultured Bradyrhizobium sp.]|uniref:hypothetical protein n=1 Tax=uncultured Bradyrhizobium sp. TaxID=199684 RepID=UPI0035CA502C